METWNKETEKKIVDLTNEFLECINKKDTEKLDKDYNIDLELFDEILDSIEHVYWESFEELTAEKLKDLYKLNSGNYAFEIEIITKKGTKTDLVLECELFNDKLIYRTIGVH